MSYLVLLQYSKIYFLTEFSLSLSHNIMSICCLFSKIWVLLSRLVSYSWTQVVLPSEPSGAGPSRMHHSILLLCIFLDFLVAY